MKHVSVLISELADSGKCKGLVGLGPKFKIYEVKAVFYKTLLNFKTPVNKALSFCDYLGELILVKKKDKDTVLSLNEAYQTIFYMILSLSHDKEIASDMANEFVEVWRSEDIEVLVLNYLTKKYFKQEVKRK